MEPPVKEPLLILSWIPQPTEYIISPRTYLVLRNMPTDKNIKPSSLVANTNWQKYRYCLYDFSLKFCIFVMLYIDFDRLN